MQSFNWKQLMPLRPFALKFCWWHCAIQTNRCIIRWYDDYLFKATQSFIRIFTNHEANHPRTSAHHTWSNDTRSTRYTAHRLMHYLPVWWVDLLFKRQGSILFASNVHHYLSVTQCTSSNSPKSLWHESVHWGQQVLEQGEEKYKLNVSTHLCL